MLVIGFCLVWRCIQISVQSVVYAVSYFQFCVYHLKLKKALEKEKHFCNVRTFLWSKNQESLKQTNPMKIWQFRPNRTMFLIIQFNVFFYAGRRYECVKNIFISSFCSLCLCWATTTAAAISERDMNTFPSLFALFLECCCCLYFCLLRDETMQS